jgi:hypothetical protein
LGGQVRRLRLRPAVAVLLLLTVALWQLAGLTRSFILPRTIRNWEARGYNAWERSALLSEGQDFLEFVSFLREAIPASGKVVLPPHSFISEAGPFTDLGFMQYFFFPRQILNCAEPVEDCVRSLTGPNSYIVAIGSFPPPEAAEEVKNFVPFSDGEGVYVPQ